MPMALVLPVDRWARSAIGAGAGLRSRRNAPEPVHEDFAAGLANWLCPNGGLAAGHRRRAHRFAGPLAAVARMSEYEFEFLGKIENRSFGWVFRAADTSNYHAVQIALDPAAATAHLARFTVLAASARQPAIAPLDLALAQKVRAAASRCRCAAANSSCS